MTAALIDVRQPLPEHPDDLPTLGAVLVQLVGEPFLFARVGYADELTLHFGTPQNPNHPRLRSAGVKFGSYILSVRGSAWLLKSGPLNRVVLEGLPGDPIAHLGKFGRAIGKPEIEAGGLIDIGAPVVTVVPFYVNPMGPIGLRVQTADGSAIVVIPTDDGETELSDWELKTPAGVAKVGPGRKWQWVPTA